MENVMKILIHNSANDVCRGLICVVFLLAAPYVWSAGWTSGQSPKWGAKVLGITTVTTDQRFVAETYVFLEPAGASNVNSCSSYKDADGALGPGNPAAAFLLPHITRNDMNDVQRTWLAEIQAAAAAGKELRIFSDRCTEGDNSGYNAISGVMVRY